VGPRTAASRAPAAGRRHRGRAVREGKRDEAAPEGGARGECGNPPAGGCRFELPRPEEPHPGRLALGPPALDPVGVPGRVHLDDQHLRPSALAPDRVAGGEGAARSARATRRVRRRRPDSLCWAAGKCANSPARRGGAGRRRTACGRGGNGRRGGGGRAGRGPGDGSGGRARGAARPKGGRAADRRIPLFARPRAGRARPAHRMRDRTGGPATGRHARPFLSFFLRAAPRGLTISLVACLGDARRTPARSNPAGVFSIAALPRPWRRTHAYRTRSSREGGRPPDRRSRGGGHGARPGRCTRGENRLGSRRSAGPSFGHPKSPAVLRVPGDFLRVAVSSEAKAPRYVSPRAIPFPRGPIMGHFSAAVVCVPASPSPATVGAGEGKGPPSPADGGGSPGRHEAPFRDLAGNCGKE
jgi:hypothetical protein